MGLSDWDGRTHITTFQSREAIGDILEQTADHFKRLRVVRHVCDYTTLERRQNGLWNYLRSGYWERCGEWGGETSMRLTGLCIEDPTSRKGSPMSGSGVITALATPASIGELRGVGSSSSAGGQEEGSVGGRSFRWCDRDSRGTSALTRRAHTRGSALRILSSLFHSLGLRFRPDFLGGWGGQG